MDPSYPPILQPAMQHIAKLEAQVADLKAQVAEHNMRLNAISEMLGLLDGGSVTVDSITPSTHPTPPVTPTLSTGSFYCDSLTFVDGEPLFPSNHISNKSKNAAYSLEIYGDNAKFKLLEGESALEFLSGDFSLYTDSVAESDNEYDFDVIGVTTNEPGEATKTDKGWKITKKAKISYKKEQ